MDTPMRRQVVVALSAAYLLVQVSSFPVALTLPSIADHFNVSVTTAAWVMIANLLVLGSTVYLAAKLGDRYGHKEAFFIGIVIITLAAAGAAFSQSLEQLIICRALQGIGAAFATGNINAILAGTFPWQQRGRAFAMPVTAGQVGVFLSLIFFTIFLQYISWRAVFITFIPLGIMAIAAGLPLLKHKDTRPQLAQVPINFVGGILFIGAIATLILASSHLHSGEESFTSSDAISYHIPMHILFAGLLAAFIVAELKMKQSFLDFRQFKNSNFSMALFSNISFHLSMLAIMTLVPIMVQKGFAKDPIFIIYVLLPHECVNLFVPMVAGWYYDRHRPRLLRPIALSLIALGIILVGIVGLRVPFWYVPLLILPASLGTGLFNTINNTAIMNSVSAEQRGFASGMIETTRHVGHTLGATIAASAMALATPVALDLLEPGESKGYVRDGIQAATLAVVWLIIAGAVVAFYHKAALPLKSGRDATPQAPASGDGG